MAGKFFEELEVGQTFRHQPGRTITEADNVFFTCLTMNPQPLHLDFHAASKAEFGKPLVNSLLTLGITVGLSVGDPERSEEHTSELQSRFDLVCRLLLEKKKKNIKQNKINKRNIILIT